MEGRCLLSAVTLQFSPLSLPGTHDTTQVSLTTVIGGQHAAYTVAKLQFFRDGNSYGTGAEANVVMAQVAKQLSDEEIQALGTYLQGLHAAAPAATAKAE